METIESLMPLPESTARCEIGPIICYKPGSVEVWYDSEGETDPVWTKLSFTPVLAMRFTPEIAVSELMVKAYSKIARIVKSCWLQEIESIALKRHQKIFQGIQHMMVFFDHYGCIEVLAKEVSIYENQKRIL